MYIKKLRPKIEKKLKTGPNKLRSLEAFCYGLSPKKIRLLEALFSDLSPKKLRFTKKLKTEAKKLSLPEVRAYRVFQKRAQKNPDLNRLSLPMSLKNQGELKLEFFR